MTEVAARREKLEQLFQSHYPSVRAYAGRRVPAETVDDVVASTFMVVWRRLDRVPSDALPWLLAVARNVIATERRTAARRRSLVERLQRNDPREAYDPSPQIDRSAPIAEALARLSARDREAITLVAWEELTPSEAALVLGQSQTAFRVRLHRAKKRLRDELQAPAPANAACGLLKEGPGD